MLRQEFQVQGTVARNDGSPLSVAASRKGWFQCRQYSSRTTRLLPVNLSQKLLHRSWDRQIVLNWLKSSFALAEGAEAGRPLGVVDRIELLKTWVFCVASAQPPLSFGSEHATPLSAPGSLQSVFGSPQARSVSERRGRCHLVEQSHRRSAMHSATTTVVPAVEAGILVMTLRGACHAQRLSSRTTPGVHAFSNPPPVSCTMSEFQSL